MVGFALVQKLSRLIGQLFGLLHIIAALGHYRLPCQVVTCLVLQFGTGDGVGGLRGIAPVVCAILGLALQRFLLVEGCGLRVWLRDR